jgi:hypothetical protein
MGIVTRPRDSCCPAEIDVPRLYFREAARDRTMTPLRLRNTALVISHKTRIRELEGKARAAL